jgi:GTP pyrophosphokinase
LAKCCNPIAGDDVFGFVTINEGIKIHRTSCPNAPELLSRHGDRVLKAVWASKIEMSFVAHLIIKGTDRMGLMNDVTRVISQDLQVNIQNLSIGVKDGIFEGKIALMVNNRASRKIGKLIRTSKWRCRNRERGIKNISDLGCLI